jgi:Anti-sigma-K factor rskA
VSEDIDKVGDGSGDPDMSDVEALLRELDVDDLALAAPPASVWAGISEKIETDPAPVVAIESRRAQRRSWILAAAAAVILIVGGGVIANANRGGSEAVLSSAVLLHDAVLFDPLGVDSAATATLLERNGHLEIELTATTLPSLTGDEDLELWLIEPDSAGNPVDIARVALVEASDPGTYRVPDGIDPSSHYVVDISVEPRDGDAAHSGRSILRGALEPA